MIARTLAVCSFVAIAAAGCGSGSTISRPQNVNAAASQHRAVRDTGLSMTLEAIYCPPGSTMTVDEGSTTLADLAAGTYYPDNIPSGHFLQFKPPTTTTEPNYASLHSSYPSTTPVEMYVHVSFASGAMLQDQCGG
jgi:hypothetical protein